MSANADKTSDSNLLPLPGWGTGQRLIADIAAHLRRPEVLPGKCDVVESLRGLPKPGGRRTIAVLPLSERAERPLSSTGRPVQICTLEFGVLTRQPLVNDPGGARGRADLANLLEGTRGALCGWVPALLTEPLKWSGGALQSLDASSAIWLDRWQAIWVAEHDDRGGTPQDDLGDCT